MFGDRYSLSQISLKADVTNLLIKSYKDPWAENTASCYECFGVYVDDATLVYISLLVVYL